MQNYAGSRAISHKNKVSCNCLPKPIENEQLLWCQDEIPLWKENVKNINGTVIKKAGNAGPGTVIIILGNSGRLPAANFTGTIRNSSSLCPLNY